MNVFIDSHLKIYHKLVSLCCKKTTFKLCQLAYWGVLKLVLRLTARESTLDVKI